MKVQQIVNLNFRNGKWNQYIFIYNQLTNRNSMKISNFRIKDRLLHKNKLDPLFAQNQDLQEKDNMNPNSQPKFDIFMEKFQQFMNVHLTKNSEKTQKQDTKLSKFIFQADYRDRYVLIDLPEFKNNKVQFQELQTWIGQLSREVLSVAFNYYSTGKFTYDQTKVYASESFLRNVCRLVNRYDISNEQLKFIDKKMQREIFPYLKTKYPMTSEKDSNKSLQKAIKEINNIEALTNDFFYYTDLEFEFRENGKYDDLIMRLINEIMKKVNQKSPKADDKSQLTNYKDFQNFMAKIFQKTYDEAWMNTKISQENDGKEITEKILQKVSHNNIVEKSIKRKQSLIIDQNLKKELENNIKNQAQKQKYKLQVRQYTDFKIGRKISENTQFFSQDQIKSGFLTIKSPAILRILTKWCEQLWQKFSNENYFIERTEGFKMQKGSQINNVFHWTKMELKNLMKAEKQNIQAFMQKMQQINYSQQIFLLKSELQNASALHMDKMERVTGKFSCKIVKNLENFTILYLNRLIHGLTTVSKNCFQQLKNTAIWSYPPNLISFKIGDLMRCKFSSKQREVLKVFQQIQRINDQEPQKMKIIRIKNRLHLGTNDVLLNVRFNDLITCQIQLAVSSAKTSFINSSYNFSHYVYQLQRSFFGPISELCSIWKNLQMRSKQFSKLIQKQKPLKPTQLMQKETCSTFNQSHTLIENDLPFICYECGKTYSQNNYIISHMKCQKCTYYKCGICQISQYKASNNKNFFLANQILNQHSSFAEQNIIPQFGICIFIKRKPLEPIVFTRISYREKDYLFKKNRQQNKIQLMKVIGTKLQVKKLFNQCVLFSLPQYISKNYINIDINLAKRQFIFPSYIDHCFKLQKETISILGEQLKTVKLDVMQNATKQQKKRIKYIQFSDTKLNTMDLISEDFISMDCLNMTHNQITSIQKIFKFPKLQKLYLNYNQIIEIPLQIKILTKLKQLHLLKNNITKLPQTITELKSLNLLNIQSNKIENLPQNFYQLQNLKILKAQHNHFKEFPPSLTKHKEIQLINLSSNIIQKLPYQIQELGNLKELNLSYNFFNKLPTKMVKMKKLQKVDFTRNKISQFINSISYWTSLAQLNMTQNDIGGELNFTQQFQNFKNFIHINLQHNFVYKINDSFQNLKYIQIVNLKKNKVYHLSQSCLHLQQLRQIDLSNNQIKSLNPKIFSKCKKIQKIILQKNYIKQFPDSFQNLKSANQISMLENEFTQFPKFMLKIINLKVIILNNFKIKFIPQDIGKLKALKKLDLSINLIQKLPDSLGELQQLSILNLSRNKIIQINSCIFKLVNIEELYFQNNMIVEFPDKFEKLKKLKKFSIEHNNVKNLPQSLENFQKLVFNFKTNPIQGLPSKLITLSNQGQVNYERYLIKQIIGNQCRKKDKITTFKLHFNFLEYVPQILFVCSNLINVDLSHNFLKELPKQISKWKKLTTLNISQNPIQVLPQQLGDLSQLITLNIQCQKLKFIPKSIQKLNLKYITFLGYKIDQIQNVGYIHAKLVEFQNQGIDQFSEKLGELINVKKIDFEKNEIQQLPQSIGNLTELNQLIVTQQKLQRIPQSIGNLPNLLRLDLLNNSIDKIPDSIGNLITLQKLVISGNKIQNLPSSISKLKNLSEVLLSYNRFQEFPSCLFTLPKLKILHYIGNSLKQIPIQLFTEVMQEFFFSQNSIKIIPKQIEKMKKLKSGKLQLYKNPKIEQIEAYDFVIQKGDVKTIAWANQWKEKKQKQSKMNENVNNKSEPPPNS